MASKPRRLALVKFQPQVSPAVRGAKTPRYPFKKADAYVFLGEIPNMPGHCVVADPKSGKFYAGYHTESFVEIPRDEL
jgi:hypothetical protein